MRIDGNRDTLLLALDKLDAVLSERKSEPLELKIVGGFALIMRDVRKNGFTQDIDSMTVRFSVDTAEVIAEIGKDLDLKLGWLNADMVLDDPKIVEGIVGEVNFEPYGEYKVLKVGIADLPTLLRLKIIAAGDNLEVVEDMIEFERHFADLEALVTEMKITSREALIKTAPIMEDYPELASKLLRKVGEVNGR